MGLPTYVVNFDELAVLLEDGIEIRAVADTGELNNLLAGYFDRLLDYLRRLLSQSRYTQHSCGMHSYIPALNFNYELIRIFDEDILITGVSCAQTGWKVLDCWSLYAGDKLLFDSVFTKELTEHKHFDVFYPVEAGTEVKIIHHNTSGSSKQVWYDIEYLKEDTPSDFPTGKDWVIVVKWENGADIDCCWADGTGGNILMGYGTASLGESPNRIFKDRDDTSANGMETWSIEGVYRDTLLWGLGWYRAIGSNNVTITITLYDGEGNAVDEITDVTGDMLSVVYGTKGEFLCVYEFDLTNPVYSEQWSRVNRMITG